MKDLIVGKKRWGNGQNDNESNVSHETRNPAVWCLRGGTVKLKIPVQTQSDKERNIENALKNVQERISQMSDDKLSDRKEFIVREVEGRAVVGAGTSADTKLLIIQEIDKAIKQVKSLLGQEQNEKMQKFYQDLISALQDKKESVHDGLNSEQIAKLKAVDSAQIAKLKAEQNTK